MKACAPRDQRHLHFQEFAIRLRGMDDKDEVYGPFGYDASEEPNWVKNGFRALNLIIAFATGSLIVMTLVKWAMMMTQ